MRLPLLVPAPSLELAHSRRARRTSPEWEARKHLFLGPPLTVRGGSGASAKLASAYESSRHTSRGSLGRLESSATSFAFQPSAGRVPPPCDDCASLINRAYGSSRVTPDLPR